MSAPARRERVWLVIPAAIAGLAVLLHVALAPGPGNSELPGALAMLGRMHPMAVHVPIGLLVTLVILEAVALTRLRAAVDPVLRVLLPLAAVSALAAFTLGVVLAHEGGQPAGLLLWHRRLAVGIVVGLCVCWAAWTRVAHPREWTPGGRHRATGRLGYRVALAGTLGVMTVGAHFGGSMTHGEGYLTAHAPAFARRWLGEEPVAATATPTSREPGVAANDARVFADVVLPVLASRCVRCHGPDKTKGKLRLDSLAGLATGGKGGPAMIPGKPGESAVITRIGLHVDDEKHMPPAGEPQVTPDELELLTWWIARGAREDQQVRELLVPDGARRLLGAAVTPGREPTSTPGSVGGAGPSSGAPSPGAASSSKLDAPSPGAASSSKLDAPSSGAPSSGEPDARSSGSPDAAPSSGGPSSIRASTGSVRRAAPGGAATTTIDAAPGTPRSSAPGRGPAALGALDPATAYPSLIAPLLADRCGGCHGARAKNGGLRTDSIAALLKGGSGGAAVVPRHPGKSLLLARVELPLDDSDHMPPEGEPQLAAGEIRLLRAWIAAGAPASGAVASRGAAGGRAPAGEGPAVGDAVGGDAVGGDAAVGDDAGDEAGDATPAGAPGEASRDEGLAAAGPGDATDDVPGAESGAEARDGAESPAAKRRGEAPAPSPVAGGGCAGCSVPAAPPEAGWLGAAMALAALLGRRRSRRSAGGAPRGNPGPVRQTGLR